MPAALVRYTNFTDTFGSSGVTGSIPVAAPASGNTLLLVIRNSFKPGDINPISVTGFTQEIDALGRTEGNHGVFRRHNITDAPTTFTFTWAGGGSRYISYGVAEISGLSDAAPIVTAHNRIVTDAGGAISATLVGVTANAFACSFNGHGSFDITGTGDFTRTPTGATLNSFMYDLDTGASGDKTVGFTGDPLDTCAVFALAYAVAGAGGGGTGSGLASKTAPIKSLVNGGLVAASRSRTIILPPRKIIVPRRAPLHLGRNFHSEARL